jgi:hypothetical protein
VLHQAQGHHGPQPATLAWKAARDECIAKATINLPAGDVVAFLERATTRRLRRDAMLTHCGDHYHAAQVCAWANPRLLLANVAGFVARGTSTLLLATHACGETRDKRRCDRMLPTPWCIAVSNVWCGCDVCAYTRQYYRMLPTPWCIAVRFAATNVHALLHIQSHTCLHAHNAITPHT